MRKISRDLNEYDIKMIALFDTCITRGGYDALCKVMELEVSGKVVYRYFDVPETVWYELRRAENLSAYVRRRISGRFQVEKRLDNTAL